MNSNQILLYSKQCTHCTNFLKELYKNPKLYDSLTKQCIDGGEVSVPPDITVVPALILNKNGKYNVLQGNSVFDWLKQVNAMENQKIKKQTPVHNGIESYDPFVMNSGLSDTFSNLDDNKPMAHCYQFIDKNSGFSGATEGIPMQKVDQPPQNSSALDSLIQQRNAEVPRGITRK